MTVCSYLMRHLHSSGQNATGLYSRVARVRSEINNTVLSYNLLGLHAEVYGALGQHSNLLDIFSMSGALKLLKSTQVFRKLVVLQITRLQAVFASEG